MEMKRAFVAMKWIFTLIATLAYLGVTAFLFGNDRYLLKFENPLLQMIPGNIMIWLFITLLVFLFLQTWQIIDNDAIKAFGNLILTSMIYGIFQTYVQHANDNAIVFKSKIFTIYQIFTLEEKLLWKSRVMNELINLGYSKEIINFDLIDWNALNSYSELKSGLISFANLQLQLQTSRSNSTNVFTAIGTFLGNHPYLVGCGALAITVLGISFIKHDFVSDLSDLFRTLGKSVGNLLGITQQLNAAAEETNAILGNTIQQCKALALKNISLDEGLKELTALAMTHSDELTQLRAVSKHLINLCETLSVDLADVREFIDSIKNDK